MLSNPKLEPHYTVQQIAQQWGMGGHLVRKLFDGEPGVLKIGEPSRRLGRKLKRRYFILRIPESALARVHARLVNKRPSEAVPLPRAVVERGSSGLHAS